MNISIFDTRISRENGLTTLIKEREVEYLPEAPSASFLSNDEIVLLCNELFDMSFLAEEHIYMLAFDCAMHCLAFFDLAHGSLTCCSLSTREIFVRLLLTGASGYVIVHNHPSGSPTPSSFDTEYTKRLKKNSDMMDLKLYDHIIIGRDGFYSYRAESNIL